MKQFKIVEIGPYPPPASGWSVRIKYVKEAFDKAGHDCQVLNLGKYRKKISNEYIDVQSGFDFLKKLLWLRLKGYHFHMHMNAQAVKGPILSLLALFVSIITFERAALTFHGGIEQLYFPRRNGRKMYWVIYFNFLCAKIIICNNEQIKNEIKKYGLFINPDKINPIQAFSIQYLNFKRVQLGEKIETFFTNKKHIISCYIVLREGFYIETLLGYLKEMTMDIGMVLVGIRNVEDASVAPQYDTLLGFQNEGKILMIENLNRDEFLSLLERSDICLRTPISDGIASSVLESQYLGTPVVASENGRRPSGVITYTADSVEDITRKINYALSNIETLKINIQKPEIKDTVAEEMHILQYSTSSM